MTITTKLPLHYYYPWPTRGAPRCLRVVSWASDRRRWKERMGGSRLTSSSSTGIRMSQALPLDDTRQRRRPSILALWSQRTYIQHTYHTHSFVHVSVNSSFTKVLKHTIVKKNTWIYDIYSNPHECYVYPQSVSAAEIAQRVVIRGHLWYVSGQVALQSGWFFTYFCGFLVLERHLQGRSTIPAVATVTR